MSLIQNCLLLSSGFCHLFVRSTPNNRLFFILVDFNIHYKCDLFSHDFFNADSACSDSSKGKVKLFLLVVFFFSLLLSL